MNRSYVAISLMVAACSKPLPYTIKGDAIYQPLTTEIADTDRGADLFSSRGGAHCVLCHIHEKSSAEFQGRMGPDLSYVSARLSTAQIRLRIVDYDAVKPGVAMPSYYRTHDLNQVETAKKDQTVLTALEIEDIIAFLTNDDT